MIVHSELESAADWYSFQDLGLNDVAVLAIFVNRDYLMSIAEAQRFVIPSIAYSISEGSGLPRCAAVFARTFLKSPVNRLQKLKIEKFNFTNEITGAFRRNNGPDLSIDQESAVDIFSNSWESRVEREDLSGEEIFFWGESGHLSIEQVLEFLVISVESVGSSSVCVLGGGGLEEKVLRSRPSGRAGTSGTGELARCLLYAGLRDRIIIYPFGEFDDREVGFNILGNEESLTSIRQGLSSACE